MIKVKDEKNLLKNFELLQNTMSRAMDFEVLLRNDFLNYFAYYFDTPLNDVSKAIEKDTSITDAKKEIKANEEQTLTEDFMKAINAINRNEGEENETV